MNKESLATSGASGEEAARVVPSVPAEHVNAGRSCQTGMRWHQYAFEILPGPFGNRKLLDVGCGGGGVVARTAESGWQSSGIDVSAKNVERLREKSFPAEVVDLNGPFPFENESFSCITFIEVAEHLVRAEHAFAEIYRLLLPGGKLLITTPNNASYRRRLKALKGRAPDDEGYHFRFWVRDQLASKLAVVGFEIEKTNSYGYFPFVDTISLHKLRTGKRRVYSISASNERLFADRFVWLLKKGE